MSVEGNKRAEGTIQGKCVGIMEANVVAVNPTKEELHEMGIEFKDEPTYVGEKEGKATLRATFWLREVKTKQLFQTTFFLEDREVENKDKTSKQYLNDAGRAYYSDSIENLPEKFTAFPYHVANMGEADLIGFMDSWLNIDKKKSYTLSVDDEWKQLLTGNMKSITSLFKGDLPRSIVAMATVRVQEKDGEKKEYQSIYNKKFLPGYNMRYFRAKSFSTDEIEALRTKDKAAKETKEWLKPFEKFMVDVTDPQYGIKDAYYIGELKAYNPEEHLQSSAKVLDATDAEY